MSTKAIENQLNDKLQPYFKLLIKELTSFSRYIYHQSLNQDSFDYNRLEEQLNAVANEWIDDHSSLITKAISASIDQEISLANKKYKIFQDGVLSSREHDKLVIAFKQFLDVEMSNLQNKFYILLLLIIGYGYTEDLLDEYVKQTEENFNNRLKLTCTQNVITSYNSVLRQFAIESGIKKYIWRTMLDDRVRPTHAANEGKIFDLDNPPPHTGHPGTEINCRCEFEFIRDDNTQ